MPTSKFLVTATEGDGGTDKPGPNLKEVSSATTHFSSSAIKHESDEPTVAFGRTEAASTTGKVATTKEKIEPRTSKTAGIRNDKTLPSPATEHNTAAYGGLGFNQTFSAGFSYPAVPPSLSSLAHSQQPIQQLPHGRVFPGQSPPFPFQARNGGGYFSGIDNGLHISNPSLGTPQPQPITITHNTSPGLTSYATVPYPYVNHYPSGQPLVQHPSGQFYPAGAYGQEMIRNVVSYDQPGRTNNDTVSMLSRIVDNPVNPPDSALEQPKKWIRWTEMEDLVLKTAVKKYGDEKMGLISRRIFYNTRDTNQCRQRWRKSLQPGLVKGNWTKEEDAIIMEMVKASSVPGGGGDSQTKWSDIAMRLPGRLGEQVKARWSNELDPELRKGVWTKTEMDLLNEAQKELGNKWAAIAQRIPGRSENSCKNRWYNAKTSLKRKAEKEAEEAEERRLREAIFARRCSTASAPDSPNSLIFKEN